MSKIHLVSYSSYAQNEIEQYRMVKDRLAPPKCLFDVTQIKRSIYSDRTASTVGLVIIGIH